MFRIILTASLAALWLIALDMVPTGVSNAPGVSGSAQAAGTVKSSKSNTSDRGTVKSSKSNTSDRKGKKPSNPPTGTPGGRGY